MGLQRPAEADHESRTIKTPEPGRAPHCRDNAGRELQQGRRDLARRQDGYDDGSLDVYILTDSPGRGKEANWLPAAAGDFSLTMRVYWPKPAMLDGSWSPPPVKRVS